MVPANGRPHGTGQSKVLEERACLAETDELSTIVVHLLYICSGTLAADQGGQVKGEGVPGVKEESPPGHNHKVAFLAQSPAEAASG